jgi:hypothetical protein
MLWNRQNPLAPKGNLNLSVRPVDRHYTDWAIRPPFAVHKASFNKTRYNGVRWIRTRFWLCTKRFLFALSSPVTSWKLTPRSYEYIHTPHSCKSKKKDTASWEVQPSSPLDRCRGLRGTFWHHHALCRIPEDYSSYSSPWELLITQNVAFVTT